MPLLGNSQEMRDKMKLYLKGHYLEWAKEAYIQCGDLSQHIDASNRRQPFSVVL